MRTRVTAVVVAVLGVAVSVRGPAAQVRPIYDMGAAGLVQLLERLHTTASVLHTGAHPDDEDSSFLARMARGDHARAAYLSLNRGEGGQNIIGTELFDALGVIRTEELLQARRLDGGEQFFTRSFDYGFSKTRAEAAAKWDEQVVLGDMVRVIRSFRPFVVYARFSGTPQDGHGQHQMAGYLTPLAFRAAADPAQFPEQIAEGLRPWQAKKLYRGAGFRPDPANPPTTDVQTGIVDAALGRTYAEIAAEGRSQHKSQEMGGIEPLGPAASGLILLSPAPAPAPAGSAAARERSVFDGLDVSLPGLAVAAGLPAGSLRSELAAIETAARQALATYQPLDPSRIVPPLADGLAATRAARRALQGLDASRDAKADAEFLLAVKERDFADALVRAAGVVVDPLSDTETVTPGGSFTVSARTFLAHPGIVTLTGTALRAPAGWRVAPAPPPATANNQGPPGRREVPTDEVRYAVTVAANAPLTQPYFLREPRRGDMYQWPVSPDRSMPFDAPLLTAEVSAQIGGQAVTITRPVQYRLGDRIRGELRRDVNVVPAVAVGVDSPLLIVPTGTTPNTQRIVVRATNLTDKAVRGVVRLRMPPGWSAEPAEAPLPLAEGENGAATFVVRAPLKRVAGSFDITAEAVVNGASYTSDLQTIAYPHIQTHRLYSPAAVKVQVFDLKVAAVKVGYIMGSGDQVPDALRRMGLDVTLIGPDMLSSGDLSRFDTIVVGVRASEARPDFVANNGRLRDYMERGGTLIVQYQQTDYVNRGLPPYPVKVEGNPRITDETAAVKILVPRHPVFSFPNAITEGDFQGWVQERNLYSFGTFDGKYTPLLEASDPGEQPQRGGEVYTDVGKGRYVYTSYAWFRQLPAGVPGAYRMFANLVSLSKALH